MTGTSTSSKQNKEMDVTDQAAPAQRNGANIALWILQAITAAAFLMFGLTKLSGAPEAVAFFQTMGTDAWLPYVIGVVEVVAAIALLVPRFSGAAAFGLTALMVGALLSHAIWGGTAVPALFAFALAAIVAWGRRDRAKELWASVAGG